MITLKDPSWIVICFLAFLLFAPLFVAATL
jgi:hypothetical protein